MRVEKCELFRNGSQFFGMHFGRKQQITLFSKKNLAKFRSVDSVKFHFGDPRTAKKNDVLEHLPFQSARFEAMFSENIL